MISTNLKLNQESLTLLGKLQVMDEEWKSHKEKRLGDKTKRFSKEGKQEGNNREDNWA